MSNERTDGEAQPKNETPGERPSWAGPRDEAVDQPLPPDLESVRQSLEPEPGPSTLSYTDDPDRQATFGMSPRSDEEQAAIDAQRTGQTGTVASEGMTQEDVYAVSELPVGPEAPTDASRLNSVFSVTQDGTLIETPVSPGDPASQEYVYSVRRDGSVIETPVTRRWNPRILYGAVARRDRCRRGGIDSHARWRRRRRRHSPCRDGWHRRDGRTGCRANEPSGRDKPTRCSPPASRPTPSRCATRTSSPPTSWRSTARVFTKSPRTAQLTSSSR